MPPISQYDEKELFLRIAEGDELAFRQVFEIYTPKLKAFFLKMTKDASLARELVQETFLNVWLYRDSLTEVEKPSNYIYRIASNVAITHFRKEDLQRKLIVAAAGSTTIDQPDTFDILQLKEVQQSVNLAVKNLPTQQQEVFRLSREQGLNRSEIAEKLGLSENTIRNHLTLALKSIQQFLRDNHALYIPMFLLMSILMKN